MHDQSGMEASRVKRAWAETAVAQLEPLDTAMTTFAMDCIMALLDALKIDPARTPASGRRAGTPRERVMAVLQEADPLLDVHPELPRIERAVNSLVLHAMNS